MKVSIIMPVYNAEATLQRSLDSIGAQTFRDFEVVFVDDCSTDSTPSIIRSFAEESGIPCKLLRQDVNGGVAAARNRGLEAAQGEFVAWVDADDTIVPSALEEAVEATSGDVDIVGWDWTLGFEKNGRYMRQADWLAPAGALKALMCGVMRWNLWLFLVRRSLLAENGIRFIDGADMGEDMMLMLKAFGCAGKVRQIHRSLYLYNASSTSSISRQFSERRREEVSRNVAEVEAWIGQSRMAEDISQYVPFLKLNIKLPLLVSDDRNNYYIWSRWFPEADSAAFANRMLPLRTRLLQACAARHMWWAVKMYYLVVYKFIYGVVYR